MPHGPPPVNVTVYTLSILSETLDDLVFTRLSSWGACEVIHEFFLNKRSEYTKSSLHSHEQTLTFLMEIQWNHTRIIFSEIVESSFCRKISESVLSFSVIMLPLVS